MGNQRFKGTHLNQKKLAFLRGKKGRILRKRKNSSGRMLVLPGLNAKTKLRKNLKLVMLEKSAAVSGRWWASKRSSTPCHSAGWVQTANELSTHSALALTSGTPVRTVFHHARLYRLSSSVFLRLMLSPASLSWIFTKPLAQMDSRVS